MISRSGNRGFLAAHYDWLALGAGVALLAVGAFFFVRSRGADPAAESAKSLAEVDRLKPSVTGVKDVDLVPYQAALRLTKSPQSVSEVSASGESFLASERRVLCKKCAKAIVGDAKLCPKCPSCGEPQEVAAEVVLDADGDGLPDEWERKVGLNPNDASDADADADGDGFTNAEEYAAKTNPRDRQDHPEYVESLKVVLPLKETYLPFVFLQAAPIPSGWRCTFFNPTEKDDYGRTGATLTAVLGEQIGATGYVLKGVEKKSAKRAIAGSTNQREVDVSEATVVRSRDGKELKLVVAESKKAKPQAVDVQATLCYERGETRNFDVVPGSAIDLNGEQWRVVEIVAVGKGAKVTIERQPSGKRRVLEALEP